MRFMRSCFLSATVVHVANFSALSSRPSCTAQFGELSLKTWPNTSPGVVLAVAATWESLCENQHGIFHCKLSTGAVLIVATDSPGYSCKAESQPCGSSHLVVHYTKTLCVAAWLLAVFRNVIIPVFTALASSFLWWRTRFKICRRCRSRIRRWATVCPVCGAEQ